MVSVVTTSRVTDGVAVRVRRDHGLIRALLDELERACAATERRRGGSLEVFRSAVWDLYLAFDEHLAMEEKYLAPLLRLRDPRGEIRAVNMIVEHNEQRRILLELVEDTEVDAKDVDALIAEALSLVAAFRVDMALEDRCLDALFADDMA